jgi:hypothetical protein
MPKRTAHTARFHTSRPWTNHLGSARTIPVCSAAKRHGHHARLGTRARTDFDLRRRRGTLTFGCFARARVACSRGRDEVIVQAKHFGGCGLGTVERRGSVGTNPKCDRNFLPVAAELAFRFLRAASCHCRKVVPRFFVRSHNDAWFGRGVEVVVLSIFVQADGPSTLHRTFPVRWALDGYFSEVHTWPRSGCPTITLPKG